MHRLSSAADAASVVRVVDVPPDLFSEPTADRAQIGTDGGHADIEIAVSHFLKQVAAGLRVETEAVLRPLNLNVSQYACLDLLEKQPGQSNTELARGAFVTRQAMSLVLRGLHRRGLINRPSAHRGRVLSNELTLAGREQLLAARAAVRRIEQRVLSPLARPQQERLRDDLLACAAAFSATRTQD